MLDKFLFELKFNYRQAKRKIEMWLFRFDVWLDKIERKWF